MARYLLAVLVSSTALLSGCIFTESLEKQENPLLASQEQGQSGCGLAGFNHFVFPLIRSNCVTCHAGSGPGPGNFAGSSASTAYSGAKSRASLGAPSSSLLVQRSSVSGHGPGCSTCGPGWGQTLTNAIQQWAQAEAGVPSVCATIPGGGGGVDDPFDDGTYNPGGSPDVSVVPEGLARFREASGTHALLRVNCSECHIQGGRAEFAPFGGTDEIAAYKAAKLRVNFIDVASSQLVQRASNDSHCGICGDPGLVATLQARLGDWRLAEESGTAAARVALSQKPLVLTTGAAAVTLVWNLGSEVLPANADLAGATFRIDVRIPAAPSDTVYSFSNPRVVAAGRALEVRELRFVVNGVENPLIATYRTVNSVVAAGQNAPLSSSIALVPIETAGSDQVGFAFSVLRAQ